MSLPLDVQIFRVENHSCGGERRVPPPLQHLHHRLLDSCHLPKGANYMPSRLLLFEVVGERCFAPTLCVS